MNKKKLDLHVIKIYVGHNIYIKNQEWNAIYRSDQKNHTRKFVCDDAMIGQITPYYTIYYHNTYVCYNMYTKVQCARQQSILLSCTCIRVCIQMCGETNRC